MKAQSGTSGGVGSSTGLFCGLRDREKEFPKASTKTSWASLEPGLELSGDAVPAIFGELRLLALWPFGSDASVSCASLATPAARPPPAGSGVGVVRDRDDRLRRGIAAIRGLTPVGAAAWSRSKAIFCATRDIATSALFFAW